MRGPQPAGTAGHRAQIGAERGRVRAARALAADGERVVFVGTATPGIYALATLVFEEIERAAEPRWSRVDVRVSPGISAMQLAAARVGAPLGHDFCAISLSDLLTPWPAIAARLRAAANADLVVALYNPASLKRRRHLVAALEILGQQRETTTPVVLARDLGRADETVEVTTLGGLDPERVDMRTLVLVGSTATRAAGGWVHTPRGYAAKGGMEHPS